MRFEAAVAVIFVLDEIAAKERPDYNVYDHLRIIPAQYFIDDFLADRRDKLTAYYAELGVEDRKKLFGEKAPAKFDEAVQGAIGQARSADLVKQLAHGHTVTWFVADQIRTLINSKFPEEFHVGPILSAGQTSMDRKQRTRNAVETLNVPSARLQSQLAPLPLPQEQIDLSEDDLADLKPTDPMPKSESVVFVAPAGTYPEPAVSPQPSRVEEDRDDLNEGEGAA